MNKTGVIIAGIALLVIGGGAYALTQNSDDSTDSANTSQDDNQATDTNGSGQSATTDNGEAVETSTITYTNDGFSPATITVKVGTTITVKNNSSGVLQFNSNPHPDHTDEEELNLDSLGPGKSTTFEVTQTGRFGFHNHLNEDDTGTLIVQ